MEVWGSEVMMIKTFQRVHKRIVRQKAAGSTHKKKEKKIIKVIFERGKWIQNRDGKNISLGVFLFFVYKTDERKKNLFN